MSTKKTTTMTAARDYFQILALLEKEAGKPLDNLYVRSFLHVAEQARGVGNSELERALDLSKAQVSRAVSELSAWSWRKDERGNKQRGLEWVRDERDPRDSRNKVWVLTDLGQRVYDKVRRAS